MAITSGVRDMQAPLNLVWEKLLPTLQASPLPEDSVAHRKLVTKLAGLTVRLPTGKSTGPLAAKVSGKWYAFPENDRGIEAVAVDFRAGSPALLVPHCRRGNADSTGDRGLEKRARRVCQRSRPFLERPGGPARRRERCLDG